jgi:thiol-disulfide isomerase/thioredoxin
MKNIKALAAGLLMFPATCLLAQDKFEINGSLPKSAKEQMVVLSYKNSEGKDAKDTAMVKNGKFKLSGTTAYANKAYISMLPIKRDTTKRNSNGDYQLFYLEKGKYVIKGADSIAKAKITGTTAQSEFLDYTEKMGDLPAKFRDISQRFSKVYYAKEKDTVMIKKIQAEARPVHARMEAVLDSFIMANPDSYVALDLIATEKMAVIDPVSFERYYAPLSKRVLAGFTGKMVTARYDKAKQIAIGKLVDFTQTDEKGKEFKLSSLKGKYVLVDFWASWCVPCRAENPNLLKAYNNLKGKNFDIVGVSLDESRAAWLAVRYGITAIPQNFLIDPQGVIIAKNLRGEGLYQELEKMIR